MARAICRETMALVHLEQWSGSSVPQAVWSAVTGIYLEAFPPSQRADEDALRASVEGGVRTLFMDREAHAFAITRPLVSAPPWVLLEYMAVSPARRGHNVGGTVLDEVCQILRGPVVLEVEHPSWAGAQGLRRLAFYERHGAGEVPCAAGYVMPDPSNRSKWLDMMLLQIPRPVPGGGAREEAEMIARAIWVESYGLADHSETLAAMSRQLHCEGPRPV